MLLFGDSRRILVVEQSEGVGFNLETRVTLLLGNLKFVLSFNFILFGKGIYLH